MGFCRDKSTRYLVGLGYNVIRHPHEGLMPFDLIGWEDGPLWLGPASRMMVEPTAPAPPIETGLRGTGIDGKSTSRLPVSIGIDLLGAIIGSLGGNVDAKASFERAHTLEFTYQNVTRDRIIPLELGSYLKNSHVDWGNPVVSRYVFNGRAKLYVVLDVVRSDSFGITARDSSKEGISIEIPVLKEVVGGNISVSRDGESSMRTDFEGNVPLAFGFICAEICAIENPETDELTLAFKPVSAGDAYLGEDAVAAAFDTAPDPEIVTESGLIQDLPDGRTAL